MAQELTAINVSLPVQMRAYIEERVKADGFGSISDLLGRHQRGGEDQNRRAREKGSMILKRRQASLSLIEQAYWISEESPETADRFIDATAASFSFLESNPACTKRKTGGWPAAGYGEFQA